MKRPYLFLFVLLSSLCCKQAYAAIDFTAKVSRWQTSYTGEVGLAGGSASLDQLGYSGDDYNFTTLILKHPIPVIPNVRYQQSDIRTTANTTLSQDFTLQDGIVYSISEDVTTTLDFSYQDVTLFYSPVDNWVQLDVGLTGRHFDASASAAGATAGASSVALDAWVPMLYLHAGFDLPLSGWQVAFTANALSYNSSQLQDLSASIGHTYKVGPMGINTETGYRKFSLDVDETNELRGNISIDGFYFSLGLSF
ncbi:MAG: TIGR04219 family outer membrane beta-barrel protein [Cellvibrionaceae bacterium]|nr:TIGR04219 family outer membrane beta-barrel protein [Cellvibrionaceae bacterium]